MTSICWKSAVTWSLLGLMFLLFVLMVGPLPALAGSPDAVLYEVTEDMYLKDASGNFVSGVATAARRSAVAQLSGWAKIGTPLCPAYVRLIVPKDKRFTVYPIRCRRPVPGDRLGLPVAHVGARRPVRQS